MCIRAACQFGQHLDYVVRSCLDWSASPSKLTEVAKDKKLSWWSRARFDLSNRAKSIWWPWKKIWPNGYTGSTRPNWTSTLTTLWTFWRMVLLFARYSKLLYALLLKRKFFPIHATAICLALERKWTLMDRYSCIPNIDSRPSRFGRSEPFLTPLYSLFVSFQMEFFKSFTHLFCYRFYLWIVRVPDFYLCWYDKTHQMGATGRL